MTVNEIRAKFLEYFKSKGHSIIASDSVVPKDDPTVLFTTAGMQQFKRQFLGHIDGYTRAATSQKCLRTDDLDKVGQTAFHHTFFEMLGNFSFGDYFKKDAIIWGWEFLTRVMGLPPEKLWVSIYKDDNEAREIWLQTVKIPADRLVKLGDKSNFWPSEARTKGPNGPCGPCSEIFYDYGVNPDCANKNCNPDCDCGRFSEVWNLVFTQYNRKDGGELEPLPGKNIDTGMGLERLTAVVQGKKNNFDTDIFAPIIKAVEDKIDAGKLGLSLQDKRIIADHIRAVVFAINDGVIPSNKERGSVVKRLINDSCNLVLSRGAGEPQIYRLVEDVIRVMQEPYPELKKNVKNVAELIRTTEEAFIKVREIRVPELKEKIAGIRDGKKALTKKNFATLGETYFIFRDTYGLPLVTIEKTAQEAGLTAKDNESILPHYHACMKTQQDRSRAGSKMAGDVFVETGIDLNLPKTQFLGYDALDGQGKVLKMYSASGAADTAAKGDTVKIILDRTPFYAESGGQVGDTGTMSGGKGKVRITDTQKNSDIYIHTGEVTEGTIAAGETLTLAVDADRRRAVMRNHTATHILQAALRTVLGPHVQQQGSLVAEDRLRFDFTHPKGISAEEIKQIEDFVNTRVLNCDPVTKDVMPIAQARSSGALAFFAEKYGDTVRVVSINGYSKEFCGGTHLDSTGQIGLFKIISESAIAQGIRRLEARTGTGAIDHVNRQEAALVKVAQIAKSSVDEVVDRVERQTRRVRQLEKDLEQFQFDAARQNIDQLIKDGQKAGQSLVVAHVYTDLEMPILRKLADLIKQKAGQAVIILGSRCGDNANLLVAVSDQLVGKGISANTLVAQAAPLLDGSGGGRPQMAQAGGKSPQKVNAAVDAAREAALKALA